MIKLPNKDSDEITAEDKKELADLLNNAKALFEEYQSVTSELQKTKAKLAKLKAKKNRSWIQSFWKVEDHWGVENLIFVEGVYYNDNIIQWDI